MYLDLRSSGELSTRASHQLPAAVPLGFRTLKWLTVVLSQLSPGFDLTAAAAQVPQCSHDALPPLSSC